MVPNNRNSSSNNDNKSTWLVAATAAAAAVCLLAVVLNAPLVNCADGEPAPIGTTTARPDGDSGELAPGSRAAPPTTKAAKASKPPATTKAGKTHPALDSLRDEFDHTVDHLEKLLPRLANEDIPDSDKMVRMMSIGDLIFCKSIAKSQIWEGTSKTPHFCCTIGCLKSSLPFCSWQPSKPSTPSMPSTPSKPSKPSKPSTTSTPSTPSTSRPSSGPTSSRPQPTHASSSTTPTGRPPHSKATPTAGAKPTADERPKKKAAKKSKRSRLAAASRLAPLEGAATTTTTTEAPSELARPAGAGASMTEESQESS